MSLLSLHHQALCKGFCRRMVLFCICALVTTFVSAQEASEQELEAIQQQLRETQAQLKEKQARAQALETQLKQAEIAISDSAKALSKTNRNLEDNRVKQRDLEQQQADTERKIAQQQMQLAAQIKSAFLAGNYDYAKMLLNQEDAAKFERVLSYYQYVSEARRQSIERFRGDMLALAEINRDLSVTITRLSELLTQQKQQQQALDEQQRQRETTLTALSQSIQTDAERVEQLQASAQALVNAIEQARQRAQQQPTELDGLEHRKGQLAMPADGRFRRIFGDRRQGSVRWTGVIIEGREGSPIEAVYQGRVLYADWLKGFGLVTIIDHGEGFMSVYGHSQALLTQPGDLVTAGQTIGLVGRSGGQASPNLYFEIRHKGKALNPSAWLQWR
ncbi:murein hydrolase activator EnvC family protein [Alteromonas flava]|uniref:murein hydrolase activator EnvC family protein n=1 Tax=Alteromonas flava TaxID=2048003 RepID=UPI001F0C85D8|nr:peptidoglycan DD-metalloendopeptidase family protein [Alteromonas flava]